MSRCLAMYLLDEANETWPDGHWLLCSNDAEFLGWLKIADSVNVFVELCPAHSVLWAEKINASRT